MAFANFEVDPRLATLLGESYRSTEQAIKENLVALVDALNKARPSGQKGIYLKKISLSSTMGVGVRVDQASLSAQQE